MTHGEKIKSMSNTQLAHYLVEEAWDCNDCEFGRNITDDPLQEKCDGNCFLHCLNWLGKETEDNG